MIKTFEFEKGKYLSYVDFGQTYKKAVLIHHGLTSSIKEDLTELSDKLALRIIVIARLGYGETSFVKINNYIDFAKITSKLLEHLKITKLNVLGVSAGAAHAYALGILLPKQVDKIFIFSGIGYYCNEDLKKKLFGKEDNDLYTFLEKSNLNEIAQRMIELFKPYFDDKFLTSEHYKDSFKNNAIGLAQELKLQSIYWGFDIESLTQKVYFHHYTYDSMVKIEFAKYISSKIPKVEFMEKEKETHFDNDDYITFLEFIASLDDVDTTF